MCPRSLHDVVVIARLHRFHVGPPPAPLPALVRRFIIRSLDVVNTARLPSATTVSRSNKLCLAVFDDRTAVSGSSSPCVCWSLISRMTALYAAAVKIPSSGSRAYNAAFRRNFTRTQVQEFINSHQCLQVKSSQVVFDIHLNVIHDNRTDFTSENQKRMIKTYIKIHNHWHYQYLYSPSYGREQQQKQMKKKQ